MTGSGTPTVAVLGSTGFLAGAHGGVVPAMTAPSLQPTARNLAEPRTDLTRNEPNGRFENLRSVSAGRAALLNAAGLVTATAHDDAPFSAIGSMKTSLQPKSRHCQERNATLPWALLCAPSPVASVSGEVDRPTPHAPVDAIAWSAAAGQRPSGNFSSFEGEIARLDPVFGSLVPWWLDVKSRPSVDGRIWRELRR